jgi:transposase InsO family protein
MTVAARLAIATKLSSVLLIFSMLNVRRSRIRLALEKWRAFLAVGDAAASNAPSPNRHPLGRKMLYLPMREGFLYLVAVMDWATRKVLAWRLSSTMDVEFRIEALEEAMARHDKPEIFNTDHGRQFTSPRFTSILTNT